MHVTNAHEVFRVLEELKGRYPGGVEFAGLGVYIGRTEPMGPAGEIFGPDGERVAGPFDNLFPLYEGWVGEMEDVRALKLNSDLGPVVGFKGINPLEGVSYEVITLNASGIEQRRERLPSPRISDEERYRRTEWETLKALPSRPTGVYER